jgi:peroxiredoxin
MKWAVLILCAGCLLAGCASQGERLTDKTHRPLAIGAEAPDFWLKNQDQQRVSLSDLSGKKNVIIVFFPLAFTPV